MRDVRVGILFCLITFAISTILEADMETQRIFDKNKPYAIVNPSGIIELFIGDESLGGIKLYVHGLEWASKGQEAGNIEIIPSAGDGALRAFKGFITVPMSDDKQMNFTEKILNADENGFELYYEIHFPEAVRLNGYQVSFTISTERMKGQKIHLIGDETREIVIPKQYESMQLGSHRIKEARVAPGHPEGFSIQMDSPSHILVQDNRLFRSSDIELRFNFHHGETEMVPAGTKVEKRFKIRYNQPIYLILDEDKETHGNDTEDWIPFVLPWDDAPLDISYLNHKPAGKHGFLKVEGDQFVFEDGTPAKFWGTCFSAGANFPTHEQSEKIARRLARFGVNIVRTHHADAGWAKPNLFEFDGDSSKKDNTLSFDPESLDRFDYLIYCLKREGIYIYLDQLVHRKFKPGDDVDAVDELPNAAKPYSNFDPRLIELQKKFSHDLWTHVNPYTGIAYKDDPAIALMEFANENDLFTQKVTLEPYRSRLEERYREWAEKHGVEVTSEPVDFTEFTEPILRFLHEVQRSYYTEMTEYLRGIGVRVPMTGSNWSRNLALLSSLMVMDYTDSHSYWDHPHGGKFNNRPMVSSKNNVFAFLSFNRTLGKPFFVSEWDQPWPNEWRGEHPLAMAAVAAFQGWNGLAVYTYRHNTSLPVDYLSGSFETFNDPARFGLFYHAALIFRRGDVRQSDRTIGLNITEEDALKSPNPSPWGMYALSATAEKHGLAMSMPDSERADAELKPYHQRIIPEDVTEVISDTDQLYRSWEQRMGTIDTPYTKAAYGFIGETDHIQLNGLKMDVKTPFATIAVSSLTDETIEKSNRLLLTAVGRAENTDFVYNILHTKMLDRGHGPILVEPIEADIELETDISELKVWAIGADGKRIKQMPAESADNKIKLSIGKEGQTIYYIFDVK
jgi:hypothetical protein